MKAINKPPLSRLALVLGLIFVVSSLILIISLLNRPPNDSTEEASRASVVEIASLITSITSLIGFLSTAIISWRKDVREAQSAKLELQRQELELEQMRAKLGRTEQGNEPATGEQGDRVTSVE